MRLDWAGHRLTEASGASTPPSWLAWAKHSIPIVYFVCLIAWEVWDSYQDNLPAGPLTPGALLADPLALGLSLLTVAYLTLIIAAYVRRGPAAPLRRGDWWSQTVALLGANLLTPLSLLPLTFPDLETLAVVTGLAGLAFSFWAMWHLGTAFSLVPEARRLVATGPYRWVRHPLYLAGFVIGLGLLAVKLSPSALGLFLAFAGSQMLRLDYEEKVLTEGLPEYRSYRRRTWALVPYIF
ncbi:MAG: isoprenylcysteine carboxylmethyltransferase family protein [Bacteroidetes bacterium]|nr:isoprenylcysteine carboxylmethyltransferase family protein [Bacteroidota bacterium]MCL5026966.1 isoprenylcysteine carboxylmethyltransferase family protein [Chloroflexota bacterium]